MLSDIEENVIAKTRRALFGDDFAPIYEILRNRIVFLDGTQGLIAGRLAARKGHFMPAGLLDSQFRTLEPPTPDEGAVTVSIDATVDAIVDDIIGKLKLDPA